MKIRPVIIFTFVAVLIGAAIGGGTLLGRNLNASPPASSVVSPQLQSAEGQFPFTMQGILLDENGDPVSNSSHKLTFAIYDDPDVSAALWSETRTVFTLDGLFTAQLGFDKEIDPDIFANNSQTWMGIRVGFNPELTPRIRMAYSPYAIHAVTADTLVTAPPNVDQVAILRWYEVNNTNIKVTLDDRPGAIAFDGESIWVANRGDDDEPDDDAVTKITVSTRQIVGDFSVGENPRAVAFDGENIWVANSGSNNLTKFKVDGTKKRTLPSGGQRPVALAFDGEFMWVVNEGDGEVVLYDVRNESISKTIAVGNSPSAIAFDGKLMWVLTSGTRNVTRINAKTGVEVDKLRAGDGQAALAFDGTSMWIVDESDNSVTKVRAADGEVLGSFDLGGARPVAIAFDGRDIWVVNRNSDNVTKIRPSDGFVIGNFKVGRTPVGIAFDGIDLWVVNQDDDTVTIR